MSSTYFSGGSGDSVITFTKPVKHLNIFVATGQTFSFSLDAVNYVSIPPGFYTFPVGLVKEVRVIASGAWQLIGVVG